jgi:hypothetical protein
VSGFFSGVGAPNVRYGYQLNGTANPPATTDNGLLGGRSAAFVGTAAVGAMNSSTYSTFVNQAYTEVAGLGMMTGGVYYEDSWTTMSLLMMSGNFLDYTNL